ncbi:hypothetical protein [Desulforhopalus sp. 52FAK]
MQLDPKAYNLPPRTKLAKIAEDTIGIIVDRKSRIIMSDGKKLFEKVQAIRDVAPSIKVSIVTTAPVCSKTRVFLKQSDIHLQEISDLPWPA